MTRNLKALGLVLVATLAIAVMTAGTASAEQFAFLSEEKETTLTGTQDGVKDVFTTTAGTVECEESSYTGTVTKDEVTEIELAPIYSKCTASGSSVTFAANGCKYRFKAATLEGGNYEGTADIVCPAGKEMEWKVIVFGLPVCTVKVPSQNGLGTVTFSTVGADSEAEITGKANIEEEIQYSHAGSACGSGSSSTGSYAGVGLIRAESGGKKRGMTVGNLTADVTITPPAIEFIKPHVKNSKTSFTIKNGLKITIGLGHHEIQNFAGEKMEEDFKIVGGTCKIPTPGELLGGTSCTVTIEWITEKVKLFRYYVLEYGNRNSRKAHKKKNDVGN